MRRLSFRFRLFLSLLIVSAIPLAAATVYGIVVISTMQGLKTPQGRGYWETARFTWRTAREEFAHIEGLKAGPRDAIARHDSAMAAFEDTRNRSLETGRMLQGRGPLLFVVFAGTMLIIVAITGTVLAAGFSGPLDEVLDWTRRIRRGKPLPEQDGTKGPAEFATLRIALRDMQRGLEQARAGELEAERLRAFGEVARRVAHEMKNPLTPIRLAVLQLSRTATPEAKEMLDVIAVESARLEAMAREFAELGRLPEGVAAAVDLPELLDDLLKSAVPDSMTRRLDVGPGVTPINGYYDPLRRAFSNLLRNAVEACHGRGEIVVTVHRVDEIIEVRVADNGPGITPDHHDVIFQPYFTEKGDGTGLGLTIVRQTIEQHHGTVSVSETPGGGATFLTRIPV